AGRRRGRQRRLGVSMGSNYIDLEQAEEEVEWARRLFRSRGWATVNLTNKSIEEGADEVITLVARWFKHDEHPPDALEP
ncbi:MAG: kinase/pyrophosphorylase, partial [Chloroflexi bacterium]|nr:kinase/pyrophosphorylase [Chloroflexota bacterium]